MADDGHPVADEQDRSTESNEPTIVDALGFELEVSNEAVAEALRASAEESAAPAPVAHQDPDAVRRMRAEASEAVPDILLSVPTPRDTEEARQRAELRHRAEAIAAAVGFVVEPEGVWRSGSGEGVTVRFVTAISSAAAAADMIAKIDSAVLTGAGSARALIVTQDQGAADALSTAIGARDSHCRFRVASLATLTEIAGLCAEGRIDSMLAQGLLVPSSHSDVARMLALLLPLLSGS